MVIHTVIQERRKALGFTQEQMADYLGVTTSAVNKWEKGTTCPDIALLSPLARLLHIDLNTLLGFYEDITQPELVRFCQEVHEVVLSDGFAAGFAAAQEKIRRYPNSDVLLYHIALQLQGLLATAGLEEEQANAYRKHINGWYERLTRSDETVIRNGSNFMLASWAVSGGQYDRAQEYLDQMPNRNDTPDKRMLQATIYLSQNQAEEAARLLEQSLLTTVNDVQTILYKLMDANIALGDDRTAAYVAERMTKLAEAFDLSQYSTALAPFLIAVANQDVRQTVVCLRNLFASMRSTWSIQDSPLYRRVSATGSSAENMIGLLVQALKQDPEYAYLQADEAFQALLAEFGEPCLMES